jgi:hypothetical protein
LDLPRQKGRLSNELRCRRHIETTKIIQIFFAFAICSIFKMSSDEDKIWIRYCIERKNCLFEFGFLKVVWTIFVESYSRYLCFVVLNSELPIGSKQLELVCLPCLGV